MYMASFYIITCVITASSKPLEGETEESCPNSREKVEQVEIHAVLKISEGHGLSQFNAVLKCTEQQSLT